MKLFGSAISAKTVMTLAGMTTALFVSSVTAHAQSSDWKAQSETAIEDVMGIPDAKTNRMKDDEVVAEITVSGDGTVKSYKVISEAKRKFTNEQAAVALEALTSLPAFSSDANETRVVTVKLSYAKVRYNSTSELRAEFEDHYGYAPTSRDAFVDVEADILES